MADQTLNIPRDTTMGTLAKDATLSSILAQLTAQQAKLQAITQALIDRDIIGNNSIAGIGDGTLTGAVVSLNNGKQKTLIAGDNIAINSSTGRIDVTGMDVSYNDLDDVPEDIAFYGDETAGAVEDIDPPLYASDVVNDLVTGGVAVPLSAEQGKALNQSLTELQTVHTTELTSTYISTGIKIWRCGKMARMTILGVKNLPTGQTNIATIPEGYRPYEVDAFVKDLIDANLSPKLRLYTDISGAYLRLYNYTGATLTNTNLQFETEYFTQ